MATFKVTDSFIYRWRFILGYSVIVIALVFLLLIAGLYVPGGLSTSEQSAAITSAALQPRNILSLGVVNAPYHLLQHVSLQLLGVTTISIKLPSLLLGLASAIGMFFLLRQWFKRNVAIIASILTITTGQFLFVAQEGTPAIMYIFWSIYLLLFAMLAARKTRFCALWIFAFFATAALSLYTPLNIYILLALASSIILHPHLRYNLRRLKSWRLAAIAVVSLILVTPLAYHIYNTPKFGLQLLGIPEKWPNFTQNALTLFGQYFNFIAPANTAVMAPIISFGSMALIALGVLHMIRAHYTARSYVVTVWSLLLLPILFVAPEFTSITFVPLLLLLATGVYTLLHEWYRLFPKNPYARVVGLLPLAVLVGGLLINGVERYMYGYHYNPEVASYFSRDLRLIDAELKNETGAVTLVTTPNEKTFYDTVAANNKSFSPSVHVSVTNNSPAVPNANQTVIITHDKWHDKALEKVPTKIVVNASARNADRFYLYKNSQK